MLLRCSTVAAAMQVAPVRDGFYEATNLRAHTNSQKNNAVHIAAAEATAAIEDPNRKDPLLGGAFKACMMALKGKAGGEVNDTKTKERDYCFRCKWESGWAILGAPPEPIGFHKCILYR